jgi:hypothetical protein
MRPKTLIGLAAGLLFAYIAFSQFKFYSDAWSVTFEVSDGQTSLDITSGKFKNKRLQILLPHAATPLPMGPRTVVFWKKEAAAQVPFGTVNFVSPRPAPGRVTLLVLGHEIDLRPQAVYLDRQEYKLDSNRIIRLLPAPPPESTPAAAPAAAATPAAKSPAPVKKKKPVRR